MTSRGVGAQVTLQVGEGYLVELEIWGGRYGMRLRADPRKLRRSQDIDWGAG